MTRGKESRPLKYPINIVRGEAGGFTVTFYETDGVTARNMSAVTFAPIMFTRGDPDPTLVTLSQSLGGAGSNVLSLSWTGTQATSLAKGQRLDWKLGTSIAASPGSIIGGPVNVFEQGEATGAASSDLTITTESLVLTLSAQAPDIAAFDSRYALLAGQRLWIPANDFNAVSGSPTLSAMATSNGSWAWKLDAGADEIVASPAVLPSTWSTFNVDLYWANAGGGSGNVDVRSPTFRLDVGAAWAYYQGGSQVVATALAAELLVVTRVLAGATATGGLMNFLIQRQGSDGADTLANDISAIGLLLTRAS
jgi:hypothetical protein